MPSRTTATRLRLWVQQPDDQRRIAEQLTQFVQVFFGVVPTLYRGRFAQLRPTGTNQHILRRMGNVDEFSDIRLVATALQCPGAQRIRGQRREAFLENPVSRQQME